MALTTDTDRNGKVAFALLSDADYVLYALDFVHPKTVVSPDFVLPSTVAALVAGAVLVSRTVAVAIPIANDLRMTDYSEAPHTGYIGPGRSPGTGARR